MEEQIETTVNAENGEVASPQPEAPEQVIEHTEQPEPETGVNDSEPADQKPERDLGKDAKFAEMRRKLEDAERKEKERDSWVERTYGQSHGLKTWEQYQQYVEKENERAYYEEKGVDPDVVSEIIDKKLQNHPDVVKARQLQMKAYEDNQMSELNKRFGLDVKSIDDVKALPNGGEMISRILNGYDWHEAYLVTHHQQIQQKAAETAKQAAMNNQQSKAHLKTPTGGGDVDTFVMPADVMAEYKRMFSKEYRSGKMTEKDFIAHYRKSTGK